MSGAEKQSNALYYTVIDGSFRTKVEEGTPEAVAREYETKDGGKAVKYELKFAALFGKIQSIEFREGDYGKTLNLTLDPDDNGKSPIVQFNVESNYGESVMKILPNVDLSKEVRIRPYSFTDEKTGKEVRGVEITHRDAEDKFTVKLKNYFYDSEKKVALNGYPTPEGDVAEYTKEDWKIFYLRARKFLIQYISENVIPRLSQAKKVEYPTDQINPDDIPF